MKEINNKNKRPVILTLLLILTFIGSGLSSFSFLFVTLSYDEVMNILDEYYADFPGIDIILAAPERYFLLSFILYTLSLLGAMLMWKMRKAGFHFYTASQLLLLILPVIMIPSFPFSWASVLITVAFIAVYGSNLKYMT